MARMNAPRQRGHSRALALPRAAAAAMFARSAPLANETIMDLSRSILSRSASAVSGEQLLIRAASTVAAAAAVPSLVVRGGDNAERERELHRKVGRLFTSVRPSVRLVIDSRVTPDICLAIPSGDQLRRRKVTRP